MLIWKWKVKAGSAPRELLQKMADGWAYVHDNSGRCVLMPVYIYNVCMDEIMLSINRPENANEGTVTLGQSSTKVGEAGVS